MLTSTKYGLDLYYCIYKKKKNGLWSAVVIIFILLARYTITYIRESPTAIYYYVVGVTAVHLSITQSFLCDASLRTLKKLAPC